MSNINDQSFLFINSQDKIGGSNYDFTISLQSLTASNLLNVNVGLHTIQFANTVYPLNSVRGNNTIYWQEDNDTGITYSAVLPETNYTGTTFASALKLVLDAGTGNGYAYTVSYDTSSKKITISEATNGPFRVVDGTNSLHRELGWDVDTVMDFKSASYEIGSPIDISGSKYVDVITNLGTRNINSTTTANTLFRIPLTVGFGSVELYQNATDDSLFISNDVLYQLSF